MSQAEPPAPPLQSSPMTGALPEIFELLREHLKKQPERLLSSMDLVRELPFRSGEKAWADSLEPLPAGELPFQPSRNSPEEAARKVHLKAHLGRVLPLWGASAFFVLGFLAICLLTLFLWLLLIELHPPKGIVKPTNEAQQTSIQGIGHSLLLEIFASARESRSSTIDQFAPRIALVALLLACLGASVWLFFVWAFPAHDPDPLFDRMLQERSPSPVSRRVVTEILGDPRFRLVFARAQETVFPLLYWPSCDEYKNLAYDGEYHFVEALGAYGLVVRVSECSFIKRADLDKFIDRLVNHLDPKGQCARFFINHSIDALKEASNKLYDHLEHEMREMLFTEIFDDPAFIYIYKRNQPQWRQALAWLSAFDLDRMLKLFRPGSSSKEKPDKMQLALLGLLLLLGLLFLNQSNQTTRTGQPSTLTLANSAQLEELIKSLRELVAKSASPEAPSPPHIEVHVLPPSAPVVNVPVTIADPSKTSPSNNNINLGRAAAEPPIHPGQSLNGSPLTNNVIVSPMPAASSQPADPPPSTGGDDFVKLEYPRSKSPGKGITSTGDTKPLTLHTAQGLACTYTVALGDASQWPRDPVTVKVLGADKNNPADCLPAQKDLPLDSAAVFSATTQPSYSGLLHAYVSVEAFHRHHLPPFAKNFIILRFHSQATPRP